jgi:membrane fusion protein (multidrug efflux system)
MRILREHHVWVPARGRAADPERRRYVGAVLALAAALAACGGKKAPPPPPAPVAVKVVTLKTQSVSLTTDLPGRTVPYRVADIRPQVNGVILKRMFVEGTDVKEGQQLYQIDPALYQAAYDSAAATAESSRLQAERYKPLAEANAVSKQDYDNAVAAAAQNKAATETAHINLVYTRLLSPISGRVGRSAVTEGALVTADQATPLATVQQLDPIYVDVTQASTVLLRLQREFAAGLLKKAGDAQAEARLVLEDDTPYSETGKLQFTEVTVDPGTGSVSLRAIFPNPKHTLLPGMFVRERLEEGVNETGLLVPQRAVARNERGEPIVTLVGADNKAAVRIIKTDRAIGDQWLVTDGVAAGDKIIILGIQGVRPGAEVRPHEVTADELSQSANAAPKKSGG